MGPVRSFPTTRTGPGSSTAMSECGFDGSGFGGAAASAIRANAEEWAGLLHAATPTDGRTTSAGRRRADRWSDLEYAAHVRDVYRLYLERLTLMLDQDDPVYPNWDQDRAAVDGGYGGWTPLWSPTKWSPRPPVGRCVRAVTASSGVVRVGAATGQRSRWRPSPGTSYTIRSTISGTFASADRRVYSRRDVVRCRRSCRRTGGAHRGSCRRGRAGPASAAVDRERPRRRRPDADVRPREYGGPEVDPVSMIEAIIHVAHADGAAGWCSMIASTTSSMAAYLPATGPRRSTGIRPRSPAACSHRTGGVDGRSRRCRRRRGVGSLGMGERHATLRLGARRGAMRRRDVPPVLVPAARRALHRHVAHGRHARIGVARLLGRAGFRAVSPDDPARGDPAGRRQRAVPVPQLHPARRGRRRRGSRCRPSSARRAERHRPGQAAAVLVPDARPQLVHADRVRPRRSNVAGGACVPARRAVHGMGARRGGR